MVKSRRISKKIEEYLLELDLNDVELKIVKDCLKAQKDYPQLTIKRWNFIQKLLKEKTKKNEE